MNTSPHKLIITTGDSSEVRRRVTTTPNTADEIRTLAFAAAREADDKKANDVVILDVGDTLNVVDLFVIVSAPNTRLVAALAGAIEDAVKGAGGPGPLSVEGLDDANWVLLDWGGFVVHVFLEETRRYYDLERLFNDAPTIDWREPAAG